MRGNGEDKDAADEGVSIKVNVIDRRHHAHEAGEAHAAGEGAAAPPHDRYPTVVEELKARTEAAEKRAREIVAAAQAEIDAVRERLQRDVERRVMEGKARLFASLLEVLDNLDRAEKVAAGAAADAAAAAGASVTEGIALIRRQLLALLKSEGVEPFDTVGHEYDPNLAEAVAVETVPADRDRIVLDELQRGYRHGQTVLRPARVKVGRAVPR